MSGWGEGSREGFGGLEGGVLEMGCIDGYRWWGLS